MGALSDALKLYGDPDEWSEDEAPARLEALALGATQFLRCGGSLTLTDFAQLSLTERAVFAACAEALRGDSPLPSEPVDIQSALVDFMRRNRE